MIPLTLRCPLCGWPFAWHDDGGVEQPVCQDCRREQACAVDLGAPELGARCPAAPRETGR
jgi:hypothetical protein